MSRNRRERPRTLQTVHCRVRLAAPRSEPVPRVTKQVPGWSFLRYEKWPVIVILDEESEKDKAFGRSLPAWITVVYEALPNPVRTHRTCYTT